MKKIITIALLAVALLTVGCDGRDKPNELIPAELYVNIQKSKTKAMNFETRTSEPIEGDTQKILTPREIVEQASIFIFDDNKGNKGVTYGITDEMKLLNEEIIKLWGEMIIYEHDRPLENQKKGELNPYLLNARDLRIMNLAGDIIAYVPNATIQTAWAQIRQAFNEGNTDKVYKLFQEAYTAVPCTTLQWKALKEKGEQ